MNKYYWCETCGRIVETIKDGSGDLICHGKPMVPITEKQVNMFLQGLEDLAEIPAAPFKDFKNIDEILDFAIKVEEDSYNFYKYWEERVDTPHMKKIFASFAEEELKHKKKIQDIKEGNKLKLTESGGKRIMDLKIGDYLVDIRPGSSMDFQDALIVAMKREKASFEFYQTLEEAAETPEMKEIFKFLAEEEAKHKLKLETIYDEFVYTEF